VVEAKIKKVQEAQVQQEMKAFEVSLNAEGVSDSKEEGTDEVIPEKGINTLHGNIPTMEKQFRDMLGNDSLEFLGDMELVVKRREAASEIIEKVRGKVLIEIAAKKKKTIRLTQTENGLIDGKERSRVSSPRSRPQTKSEATHGPHQASQDKTIPNSERNTISSTAHCHQAPRPIEPKRFTPTLIRTRPTTGNRSIIRSRAGSRKLNLSIDIKSIKSAEESSTKGDNNVKYVVSDQIQASPEPSLEIFSKLAFYPKNQLKASGTMEDFYVWNNTLQKSLHFATDHPKPVELSARSDSKKRPNSLNTPNHIELISVLHNHKQKNIAAVFNNKLQKIRNSWLNRTYN